MPLFLLDFQKKIAKYKLYEEVEVKAANKVK
ncbi:hypothetical protein BTU51_1169 [Rickettsia rickettsii]|uniref:Uncharacterized protein n=1 Tax=Rickettsia rickettsii (strain Iowa) TaxID=452659 RepID=B0BUN3_RICRO|nr:hypothetical protein RrIowa_1169 [Rickettsia rickettsii str. Iowa]APU55893.1 hypothetical protein BTU50_1169 [Rickettsia rickettsii]APU57270.1 hypothetical protein BTU51_1169 [Rickettsia rickettsii]